MTLRCGHGERLRTSFLELLYALQTRKQLSELVFGMGLSGFSQGQSGLRTLAKIMLMGTDYICWSKGIALSDVQYTQHRFCP